MLLSILLLPVEIAKQGKISYCLPFETAKQGKTGEIGYDVHLVNAKEK
jgi:hypothetical protein